MPAIGIVFRRVAGVPHSKSGSFLVGQYHAAFERTSFPGFVGGDDRVVGVFFKRMKRSGDVVLLGDEIVVHEQLPGSGHIAEGFDLCVGLFGVKCEYREPYTSCHD